MPPSASSRLPYIDWMRGLACVLMFQTHCYDSWLSPSARKSAFFTWSQLGGTLPAPLFLFLSGISCALIADRMLQKGVLPSAIGRTILRRGAEILGLGLLFRVQEYLISWGWAPWSDLFRVDILNTIGVGIMLMGALCWAVFVCAGEARRRVATIGSSIGAALLISLLTPLVWTSWRPDWLPWPIESYINGVHNLGQPQSWLFPIFPWVGFSFAGLAAGFFLLSGWAHRKGAMSFAAAGVGGVGLILFARWMDAQAWQVYPVYDFWHTSPNFFLIRVGLLLVILAAVYAWCRWGAAQWGFSPLVQLGKTSLLVYWVHIELVYGRFSILPKHVQSVSTASVGLLTICLAMLLLSMVRTWRKGRGVAAASWLRPVKTG